MSAFDTVLKKTIGNVKYLALTSGTPAPSGSDIVDNGGNPIESGDLAIRDTNSHYFSIPMALSGWRRLIIGITNDATPHDQTIHVSVRGAYNQATTLAILADFDLSSGANHPCSIGEGAVGTGATPGADPSGNSVHHDVPAVNAGFPYIMVRLSAAVAPTTGSITMRFVRSS